MKLMNKIFPFVSGRNERKEVVKIAMVIASKNAKSLGFKSISDGECNTNLQFFVLSIGFLKLFFRKFVLVLN